MHIQYAVDDVELGAGSAHNKNIILSAIIVLQLECDVRQNSQQFESDECQEHAHISILLEYSSV